MSSPELADDACLPDTQPDSISSRNPNSSPPRATRSGQKEQRPPSVTPRKFRRFFTPRSNGYGNSAAREALQEITAPTLNRNVTQSSPLRPYKNVSPKEDSPTSFIRSSKRQKTTHTPETSPRKGSRRKSYNFAEEVTEGQDGENLPSSPCERAATAASHTEDDLSRECQRREPTEPLERIVSRVNRGLGGQLLDLSISGAVNRRHQHHVYPANGLSKRPSIV